MGAPAPVNIGIVLYTSAAALGTVVALVRGNEPMLIAGQALSMGLLPLGFVASQTVSPGSRRVAFVRALVGSVVVASVIHFAYWTVRLSSRVPQERLYLPNAISMAGLVLIALLLSTVVALGMEGRRRWRAVAVFVVLGVYLVGTGTRSLWAAAALGIVVFFAIEFLVGPRSRSLTLAVVAVAVLALLGGGAVLLATRIPHESVFPDEAFEPPFWRTPRYGGIIRGDRGSPAELVLQPRYDARRTREEISQTAELGEKRLFLASAEAYGVGEGSASVDFVFSDRSGRTRHNVSLPFSAEDAWVANERLAHRIPDDMDLVHVAVVVLDPAESTEWRFRRVRLEHFRTRLAAPIAYQLIYLGRRVFGPWGGDPPGTTLRSASLDYRYRESKRLVGLYRESSRREKLIGHGLGARFSFQAFSYDTLGQRILIANPNYIHNFYAFLLYKLGVFGTLLILGSICAWIGWAVHVLCDLRATSGAHWIAAYLAILVAYLAWGIFCPELIDFRVAPVVGFLIGSLGTIETGLRADDTSPVYS
jgi:O-antigen ligase